MSDQIAVILAVVTAFFVGFAMKYGGLCTYAAGEQIVREHRYERLQAFLAAAAWTILFVLPMTWYWPEKVQMSMTHHQWMMALLGGTLLGLGAFLNRGCVFGTFVQLTGGNMTYVATLVGMIAGATGARLGFSAWAPARVEPALATEHGIFPVFWLLLAALFAAVYVVNTGAVRIRCLPVREYPAVIVSLVLGIGGGWLFASVAGWDLAAVVLGAAYHAAGIEPVGPGMLAVLCTLSMVAGGIVAAVFRHRFQWRAPVLPASLASFAGGLLMGVAAILLPGGNDGLLLSGIPGFAPHAIAGYAAMLASLVFLSAWKYAREMSAN